MRSVTFPESHDAYMHMLLHWHKGRRMQMNTNMDAVRGGRRHRDLSGMAEGVDTYQDQTYTRTHTEQTT